MNQDSLKQFGAYRNANQLFDLVVADMDIPARDRKCYRRIPQQAARADSIAANIEEGYGRGRPKEYIQFLRFARGSARETRGRYTRMRHWLPGDVISIRFVLCDEIIAILNATISTLQPRHSR